MKSFIAVMAVMAALGSAHAVHAQQLSAELNLARVDDVDGGELGLGYSFAPGNFRFTPTVGAFFYQGDNTRYRSETLSNGNVVCRDHSNGQFANKELCDNTAVKAYGRLEGAYRFSKVEVGAGVRVGSDTAGYGTISALLTPAFSIKANIGSDYYAAGLHLGF